MNNNNHEIKNYLKDPQRRLEMSNLEITRMSLYPLTDCNKWKMHYDNGLKIFNEIATEALAENPSAGDQIAQARAVFDQYKNARAACGNG